MPHAVAITRLASLHAPAVYRAAPSSAPPSLEALLPTLASLVGATAFDLRMRLAGDAPWVVARPRTSAEAEATVASLRAAGFGAVHCDVAEARAWSPSVAAVVSFEEGALVIGPIGRRVACAEVRVALVATLEAERETEGVERVQVSRNARGAPQFAEVSRFSYGLARQRALYLVTRPGERAVRLAQEQLRAADAVGVTGRAHFDHVVAALRARAPDARFDERLAAAPRRRSSFTVTAAEGERRGAVTSNVAETDLAAWLLALAHAERQVG